LDGRPSGPGLLPGSGTRWVRRWLAMRWPRPHDDPRSLTALTPAGERISKKGSIQLGFWTASLTAFVAAVFAVSGVATPARSRPFCLNACVPSPYVDVARFIPGDYLWLIPGILLAPIFVGLMAS